MLSPMQWTESPLQGTTAVDPPQEIELAPVPSMWSLTDFELGEFLGKGSFSRIRRAVARPNGVKVALKAISKKQVAALKVQRHLVHEIDIQAHLCHPHILRLFGFFWDATHIYMILEHAECGDLRKLQHRQPHKRFSDCKASNVAAQVASALAYCHQLHVLHRDVKPENILITEAKHVKLADFGWATQTCPGEKRHTLCGTIDYLSPEVVKGSGHAFPVDAWALGVLSYELLVGEAPFYDRAPEETYRKILQANPQYPKDVQALAQAFMTRLLAADPEQRMTLDETIGDPWLSVWESKAQPQASRRIACTGGA
mmetsp:Transcript_64890/g.120744  ORF Transcript_64890/g.120744 Transcript_64890/m.120744 type:complete len:313 (+) Transcript_64890:34-972(+)